jgi:hypothetical protein
MGKIVSLAGERREWHATLSYERILALWKVGLPQVLSPTTYGLLQSSPVRPLRHFEQHASSIGILHMSTVRPYRSRNCITSRELSSEPVLFDTLIASHQYAARSVVQ